MKKELIVTIALLLVILGGLMVRQYADRQKVAIAPEPVVDQQAEQTPEVPTEESLTQVPTEALTGEEATPSSTPLVVLVPVPQPSPSPTPVVIPSSVPQSSSSGTSAPSAKPVPVTTTGSCASISIPSTYTEMVVSSVDELYEAVAKANEKGSTVVTLNNGTYTLSQGLWISGNDIVFRGASDHRADVTVRGDGMFGNVASVFQIAGDRVTIADMTVGYVANHPIQVHGEMDADDVRIHNVSFVDGFEQLLKGSYDAADTSKGADRGIVECSRFEYSAGIGPNWYIGGIDVHNGKDWIVRDNIFLNIRSPQEDLAEHAIHFWSGSRGTRVERNTIINSDRGIGFGLDDRGHVGGVIRDNVIYHNTTAGDVGIGLESARDVEVANNKIYFDHDYPNAIEYRFEATTGVNIHDNTTNRAITSRDGATGTVSNNTTNATRESFAADLIKWGL